MGEKSKLFLVRPGEKPQPMTPSAPANEDEMQKLIADYPELISDGDGDLLLIEREHGISDTLDGASRWSLDHLFVTREAVPVLVEVKRAVDTRLRREVVGQLLDYAANGVAYWPKGSVAARFAETCGEAGDGSAESTLAEFLKGDSSPEIFWDQVDANFRAGRIKLVFVADEIPSELARIVEFLNDQMTADVRAVELRYFEGDDGVRTLMPRIIGETERSRVQKRGMRSALEPITQEEWVKRHIAPKGDKCLKGAEILLDMLHSLGAETDVASTQGSIYTRVLSPQGKANYPIFMTKGRVQIGFGWIGASSVFESNDARESFFQRFDAAIGPLSTKNIRGFPSFPLERLGNIEQQIAFRKVVEDFLAACAL